MANNKTYLGLDISTTCVGITVFEDDNSLYGKIVENGFIKIKIPNSTSKEDRLTEKFEYFKDEFLNSKFAEYNFDTIVIEQPLLSSNNKFTCGTLLQFNGMLSGFMYEHFGCPLRYISSYDARKFSFPTRTFSYKVNTDLTNADNIYAELEKRYFDKKTETFVEPKLFGAYADNTDKKLIMLDIVKEVYPYLEWKTNRNGDFANENLDASDSIVVAVGYRNKEKFGELNPKGWITKKLEFRLSFFDSQFFALQEYSPSTNKIEISDFLIEK